MAKITVWIEEGKVTAVDGVPTDVYVEVRNYDTDRLAGGALPKDEEGGARQILEWRAPE
jgi:hypothetical protein